MNVDNILSYKPSDDEDLYALLGCDESATVEQITAEYKALALQYHPDKNEGNKEAEAKFQQLKNAKEILCDPEKRNNYDKWRHSGISISYKQWLGMKEHVQQSMHWSTPKTKDRMLPDSSGASGSPGNARGQAANPHRRASEGGANIYYGRQSNVNWESQAPTEVINKFRNYEI
ncbi:J domain-containing protein-like [Prorops nasuta]|uniref:J domain-containing protein-like n=1 Tax=Prorops nasuta TaxID=863751 RepID=UPI0034CFB4B9